MEPAPNPSHVMSGVEWLIYIVVGTIASIGAMISRQKKKSEPPAEFAVTSAQFADMKPVRDLSAQVSRLADAVEGVRNEVHLLRKQIETHVEILDGVKSIMRSEADEAYIQRQVNERLERAKG